MKNTKKKLNADTVIKILGKNTLMSTTPDKTSFFLKTFLNSKKNKLILRRIDKCKWGKNI